MGRKAIRLSDRTLQYIFGLSYDRHKELEKLFPSKSARDDKIRSVIDIYILGRGDNEHSSIELKLASELQEARDKKKEYAKLEARRRKELKALKEKKKEVE